MLLMGRCMRMRTVPCFVQIMCHYALSSWGEGGTYGTDLLDDQVVELSVGW